MNCGGRRCSKEISHSGLARKAETTYERYTTHILRKIRSTHFAVPAITIAQTSTAARGTAINRLTPNVSLAQNTPVNSAITLPRFTISTTAIRKNVTRNPNSSLIKSERPLPVTAPMREHISSDTYSTIVIGIRHHNTLLPYFDPDSA